MAAGGDQDGSEDRSGGSRTQHVEREALGSDGVHEREQKRADDEGGDREKRHEGGVAKPVAGISRHPLSLLERPVRELAHEDEGCTDNRRRGIERPVVEGQLDSVRPAAERDRDRNQRRPPEHERRDEHDQRDGGDPDARRLQRPARTGYRNGRDRAEARERADGSR